MLLTNAERARLDPRVNVERLEEFLLQVPVKWRALALNGFYADPSPDLGTIIGSIDPAVERLWRRVWGEAADDPDAPSG